MGVRSELIRKCMERLKIGRLIERVSRLGRLGRISITLVALLAVLAVVYISNGQPEKSETELSRRLNALPVGESIKIGDVISLSQVSKVCLLSTDSDLEQKAEECSARVPSLVLVGPAGQCTLVDLSTVRSRILTGSLETECRPMSTDLSLSKFNRFGQHHIIFLGDWGIK
jgi:hypothetical protein